MTTIETNKAIYTSESGTEYTYCDILNIAKGNKEYAKSLIDRATWQHIETLVDEDLRENEIIESKNTYKFINQQNK
jgi:hypothetical protein